MSHEATNWAYKLDLPMAQKFVLVALADRADEDHSCYPGQKMLAGMVGASVATIRRALVELEKTGLITRKRRFRDDGYRTSDRYVLNVGTLPLNLTTGQSDHRSNSETLPLNESHLTAQSEGAKNHQLTTRETSGGTRKRATQLPDTFTVTPDMRAWATEKTPSVDVDTETEQFKDHHQAKGSKFMDWRKAWQTWMRKSQQWAKPKPSEEVPREWRGAF